MAHIWFKSIVQSALALFVFFFSTLFLSVAGIRYFSEEAFTTGGFAILFAYTLFNVFGNANWK